MAFNPNDPEFIKSKKPSSSYANRAYVTSVEGVARVSFGEAAAGVGDTNYHTAVTMSPLDALALADAIHAVFDEAYPPSPLPPPPRAGLRDPYYVVRYEALGWVDAGVVPGHHGFYASWMKWPHEGEPEEPEKTQTEQQPL